MEPDRAFKRKRVTRWCMAPELDRLKEAIRAFRCGEFNTVQIVQKLGVPERTLRRYVAASRCPADPLFFMAAPARERVIRMRGAAGEKDRRRSGPQCAPATHNTATAAASSMVVATSGDSGGGGDVGVRGDVKLLALPVMSPIQRCAQPAHGEGPRTGLHITASASAESIWDAVLGTAVHSTTACAAESVPASFVELLSGSASATTVATGLSDAALVSELDAGFIPDADFTPDALSTIVAGLVASQWPLPDALFSEWLPLISACALPLPALVLCTGAPLDPVGLMEREHWLERNNQESLRACATHAGARGCDL